MRTVSLFDTKDRAFLDQMEAVLDDPEAVFGTGHHGRLRELAEGEWPVELRDRWATQVPLDPAEGRRLIARARARIAAAPTPRVGDWYRIAGEIKKVVTVDGDEIQLFDPNVILGARFSTVRRVLWPDRCPTRSSGGAGGRPVLAERIAMREYDIYDVREGWMLQRNAVPIPSRIESGLTPLVAKMQYAPVNARARAGGRDGGYRYVIVHDTEVPSNIGKAGRIWWCEEGTPDTTPPMELYSMPIGYYRFREEPEEVRLRVLVFHAEATDTWIDVPLIEPLEAGLVEALGATSLAGAWHGRPLAEVLPVLVRLRDQLLSRPRGWWWTETLERLIFRGNRLHAEGVATVFVR